MINSWKEINNSYLNEVLKLYNELLYVFGIEESLPLLKEDELELVKNWQKARSEKDFEKADYYRNLINESGIILW